ncbi:MAG: tetratricopeptide repeat protein [Leptolyngbya sp. SIO1E4]|nr:tetratricopeptide repeat protein [Leptolyngbya sp. SIO1E4]
MQDLIAAALAQKDFRTAAALLKQWKQKDPKDPRLLLMIGQYQEATERWELAEKTYLKLLRQAASQKLMGQARQGIQRVQSQIAEAREDALETARAQPESQEPGLLCLEPVQRDHRKAAAQGLAKIMQIDPYTAGLQLPSKGWRLYRVGPIGEMQYYGQALVAAQTPAFWVKQADVNALQVFRLQYFRRVQAQAEVVCQNVNGQSGAIAFNWAEVTQVVSGQLPLFESVVDTNAWGKLQRKEKTQDYAEIIDLHLHERKCILRVCDRTYDFRQGNPLPNADTIPDQTLSTRPHWNALTAYIREQVQAPMHSGFAQFGEGALEYLDLLPTLKHHISLPRSGPTNWDPAFHLYSGLHFLRPSGASLPV